MSETLTVNESYTIEVDNALDVVYISSGERDLGKYIIINMEDLPQLISLLENALRTHKQQTLIIGTTQKLIWVVLPLEYGYSILDYSLSEATRTYGLVELLYIDEKSMIQIINSLKSLLQI